ncbi:hypothetical protein LINPERHAP2_LOCUS32444 [Linum perenne]
MWPAGILKPEPPHLDPFAVLRRWMTSHPSPLLCAANSPDLMLRLVSEIVGPWFYSPVAGLPYTVIQALRSPDATLVVYLLMIVCFRFVIEFHWMLYRIGINSISCRWESISSTFFLWAGAGWGSPLWLIAPLVCRRDPSSL